MSMLNGLVGTILLFISIGFGILILIYSLHFICSRSSPYGYATFSQFKRLVDLYADNQDNYIFYSSSSWTVIIKDHERNKKATISIEEISFDGKRMILYPLGFLRLLFWLRKANKPIREKVNWKKESIPNKTEDLIMTASEINKR
jgi:hypothetical protein